MKVEAQIDVPGSKYIANRALIIAGLSKGESTLVNVPDNDDISIAIEGLRQLGIKIRRNGSVVHVEGCDGSPDTPKKAIYTGGSGTFTRFIVPVCALCEGESRIEGNDVMSGRPMKDLLDALSSLGVRTESEGSHLPIKVYGGGIGGGHVELDASISSQYLSSLLMISPYARRDVFIKVKGELVSRPYVEMTLDVMHRFGVHVSCRDGIYHVMRYQKYHPRPMGIEADPSSSSYFMGLAAVSGGSIRIRNFDSNSLQGEAKFPDVLEMMGCKVERSDGITIRGPKKLQAVDIDMGSMPDVVQTVAVLACFAKGITRIRNVANLKYKESDRIINTVEEIRKLGIIADYTQDTITVSGGKPKPASIDAHNDHRMAMSFAIAKHMVPRIRIKGKGCVSKSFPQFWDMYESVRR